jgi:hypothetical protein
MFEFTALCVVVTLVGSAYLLTVGRWLIVIVAIIFVTWHVYWCLGICRPGFASPRR